MDTRPPGSILCWASLQCAVAYRVRQPYSHEYRRKVAMAWLTVMNYRLGYSIPRKQFFFYYELQGEAVVHQLFPAPDEFMALADMFRNEGPILFNTEGQYFVTGAEPAGENEPPP